jgi:membrane dipeptidase
MKIFISLMHFLFCAGHLNVFAQINSDSLHFNSVVVDMHTDVLDSYFKTGRDFERYSKSGHVDFDRLKTGGVDVQFFVLWPDPKKAAKMSHYNQAVRALDTLHHVLKRNPEKIKLAVNTEQINEIISQNKIAACIGLEGGTAIDNDLNKLQYFYDRGVRYLGLTWNDSPQWASSAADEENPNWRGQRGLSDFGLRVIAKMNELGMMIDVSHSGEKTFYDVLAASQKPVIASHSSVYSICRHRRNLKDDQIKALAKNGGVVFINFYPVFLLNPAELKKRKATVQTIADHIEYVVNLVGDDYVGLGSDFDGVTSLPQGMEDVTKLPAITKELAKRGFSASSIRKILGGNFIRVLTAQN